MGVREALGHNFPLGAYPKHKSPSPSDFLPLSIFQCCRQEGQQRWDEYSTDHSSIGKAVELDRMVKRAKKADPAYFDRVHSLPIRRLRHCTHLSEAARIITRRGEVTSYRFKGFKFKGFQGDRRHVPFVYDSNKRTYVRSDGDKFAALGKLVWFGLETSNDDKETIRKKMRVELSSKTRIGRKKLPRDTYVVPKDTQFATSPQFSPESRYGNFSFSISTEDFVEEVAKAFRKGSLKRRRSLSADSPRKKKKKRRAETGTITGLEEAHSAGESIPDEIAPGTSENQEMCFHCGGTLFYQSEVAYVVVIAARNQCKKFSNQGFPCFGTDKRLIGRQPPVEEVAKDAPDLGIPGGPILFAEPCNKASVPRTDENFAAFRVKSTAYEVKYKKKAVEEKIINGKTRPAQPVRSLFRSQYWENLVFAVAAKRLKLTRCQLNFVDHDINCCQPSLRLPAEKTSRGGMRMNCHKGGYPSGDDAKQALDESLSILGKLPGAYEQPQQLAAGEANPQHG